MKIEEIDMTPALAAKLLEQNTLNRLLSPARVNTLADAIDRGGWLIDANPVKIGDDGTVIDGQHRLHAIVKAGKKVRCLIARDVPSTARMSVDTGRPRSFADYLRLNGVTSATDVAAITRFLYWYRNGMDRKEIIDLARLWEFYQKEEDAITEATARSKTTYHYVRSIQRSVMGTAWAVFSDIDREDAETFWSQLRGDVPACSGANALCTFGSTRQLAAGHFEQRYGLAIVIKSWNAFRRGAEVSMLSWRPGANERYPEPK